jgi:hypothetical protein
MTRLRALLGVGVAAVGLAVFDFAGVLWRSGGKAPALALGVYVLVTLGLAAGCLAVTNLFRTELRLRTARLPGAPLVHGALDGLGIWLIAIELGRPETIRGGDRYLVLAMLLSSGAVGGAIAARSAKLALLASAAAIALALTFDSLLPYREYAWTRLCLGAVIAAACARLSSPLPLARLRQGARVAVVVGAGCLALADPLLRASTDARAVLQRYGAQGAAFARVLWVVSDVDGDQAPSGFGAADCAPFDAKVFPAAHETPGDGIDDNCDGGDGVPGVSRARAGSSALATDAAANVLAHGPDVLVLSLDGLRFDMADALEALRRELGPLAELTRAVSPASRTLHSIPATMRGRSMRELVLARHPRFSRATTPWMDPSTSLAQVLNTAGYRTLSVPTHRHLHRDSGMLDGFESLPAPGVDLLFELRSKLRSAVPIVTAKNATRAVLDAARATPTDRPVFAFIHAMETHEPYRWGEGQEGPLTPQALRRSATETAQIYASFVRQWRVLRGAAPLIAVLSDHGEEFGEHGGRFHCSSVHAEQVRVVFWLAGPGVPSGRFDGPTSTTALPATLLELLGIPAAPTMTVPSLLPALRGAAPFPELAVSELRYEYRQSVGYTGARYRLVRDPVNRIDMLFDADRDPLEQHDLAGELPEELGRMRALAHRWDESH